LTNFDPGEDVYGSMNRRESRFEVENRVLNFLKKIRQNITIEKPKAIVLVSHASFARHFFGILLHSKRVEFYLGNCECKEETFDFENVSKIETLLNLEKNFFANKSFSALEFSRFFRFSKKLQTVGKNHFTASLSDLINWINNLDQETTLETSGEDEFFARTKILDVCTFIFFPPNLKIENNIVNETSGEDTVFSDPFTFSKVELIHRQFCFWIFDRSSSQLETSGEDCENPLETSVVFDDIWNHCLRTYTNALMWFRLDVS
jgi:hypothetical protein